jgi:cell division protein FtsB
MATISITSELDVINKYKGLVSESMGSDSVYIRTKETLEDFFKNNNLKDSDKAAIISQVLSSLNTSLVNSSMSTAMQWAANEKDVALKKLELEQQLDILANEVKLKDAQIEKMKDDSIATQAQTIRMFGTPTIIDGNVASLTDTGKLYKEIQLIQQQTLNAGKEGVLLDAKKTESQAAVHKVVADTYRNYGSYTFALADGGLTGVSKTSGTYETLSDIQAVIAKEQANGYSYNAWANAMNGSASLIGTALAGEADIFTELSNGTGDALISTIRNTACKLNSAVSPYGDAACDTP